MTFTSLGLHNEQSPAGFCLHAHLSCHEEGGSWLAQRAWPAREHASACKKKSGAAAVAQVPSWKFLPLVYQLASRLSRPGAHPARDASGFTVRLSTTCVCSDRFRQLDARTARRLCFAESCCLALLPHPFRHSQLLSSP